MDAALATQHATAVAREVVRVGLADQELVRVLYQEYAGYLRQGVTASFTQLLLSRKVIDQRGFDQLQAAVPMNGPGNVTQRTEKQGASTREFGGGDQPLEISVESSGPRPPPGGLDFAPTPESHSTNTPARSAPPISNTFDELDLAPAKVESTTGSLEPAALIGTAPPIAGGHDPSADFLMSDDVQSDEEREPVAGDKIGKYLLIKEIGRGGMGVIFTAHRDDGETFALKILMGGQDKQSDRRRQRFRREIEAMRRLEHKLIVRVYDYGRKGNSDWYSMDFVPGSDFEKILEEGGLEPSEKMQVYYDICEAMAHAHERNVIHRDLKPQNVIVDGSGRGHVLDFGLAKIMDQGIGMTRTGSALGTPFYMAPEQLRSAKHIDARADVFSLGVILYEVATGERPFKGQTAAEVGTNILNVQPPRPSQIKKDLHPDIDAICLKALEKDRNRRYADANELWEDLIRHKKGFGVEGESGMSGALSNARRWADRNKGAVIGVAITAAVFIPALLFFALKGGSENNTPVARTGVVGEGVDPVDDPGIDDSSPDAPPPADPGTDPPPPTDPVADPPPSTDPVGPRPAPRPDRPPVGSDPPARDDPPPVRPKPTVTEPDKPAVARSPGERALLALAPPEEHGPAGADEAGKANTTDEALTALIFALEQLVIPAMACGDLQRAADGLGVLKRNSSIRGVAPLAREVEHDISTLKKLRKMIGIRLSNNPRLLSNPTRYQGDRARFGRMEVLEDGFLEFHSGAARTILDPLGLEVSSVRPVVIVARSKKKVDNTNAHYALAVLAVYRARTDRTDYDKGGDSPALRRRRRLADWLFESHKTVWRGHQAAAENAWRELDRKTRQGDSAFERALEEFVEVYSRTSAYQDRRAEWLRKMVKQRPLKRIVAGKSRKSGNTITWNFRGDQARDFVVGPVKNDAGDLRSFRAESQSKALVLENARAVFPLGDLTTRTGSFDVSGRSDAPIRVVLGDVAQVIDPNTSWVVRSRGQKVGEDIGSRKMSKLKTISFEDKPDKQMRVFRIKPKVIEIPARKFGRPSATKKGNMTVGSEGAIKVAEVSVSWLDADNPSQAGALRLRIMERILAERESSANADSCPLIQRNIPESLVGLVLWGEWKATRRELTTSGGNTALWIPRKSRYGAFEFEFACDDGPGVRLSMAGALKGKTGDVLWRLPSTVKTSPGTYRKVVCSFNLAARFATVKVDGIRLPMKTKRLPAQCYFGIEFLGRTTGSLRNIRLLQFEPAGR